MKACFLLNARDMRKVIYFRKKVLLKGIHHLVCVSDINFRVPQLFNFHIGAHAARELVLRSVLGNNSIKLQYDNCKEMSDNLHSFIIIPQIKELYLIKLSASSFMYLIFNGPLHSFSLMDVCHGGSVHFQGVLTMEYSSISTYFTKIKD